MSHACHDGKKETFFALKNKLLGIISLKIMNYWLGYEIKNMDPDPAK